MANLWFHIRALLCELLVHLSLKICPEGYVPSYVKACVDVALESQQRAGARAR